MDSLLLEDFHPSNSLMAKKETQSKTAPLPFFHSTHHAAAYRGGSKVAGNETGEVTVMFGYPGDSKKAISACFLV